MGAKHIGFQNTPRLVAIIGGSGAGKTYLAGMLEQELGGKILRLSLDDFYRDRSACPATRRDRINFDHPEAIDWKTLEAALVQLAKGRPATIPQYDFATHTRRAEWKTVQPQPVIVVEGLWPLHRARIRKLFDFRIFLQCAAELRLQRRLRRDVAERQRTPESVLEQFKQTVAPMHRKFVAPQATWSDVVVRRTLEARDVTLMAKRILG
ncbi:MAG TPA: uridine kinase [Verrucomicrobiae bacterium]|jgi:uridine kinase|nr:uridine kinase [Verrucomicrobiae bacterium]